MCSSLQDLVFLSLKMLPTSCREMTPTLLTARIYYFVSFAQLKNAGTYQVGTCLSGNPEAVGRSSMIEILAIPIEAAFDWTSAGGYLSIRGGDELHQLRHEREEVVSSAMMALAASKRHAARHEQARHDLARVYPMAALQYRRA
jgi:hypothetical protein